MKKALALASLLSTLAWAEPAVLVISDIPMRPDRSVVLGADVHPTRDTGSVRAIAVGERGTVLISENGGADWKAFRSGKTTRTLTSAAALDDRTWIGAGHGGVLLRSEDGGRTGQLIETEAGKDSFLGLTVLSPTTVLAYGAFGLMLRSEDAGRTWKRQQVIDAEFDRHINRIIAGKNMLLLAGESGTLARSTDGGLTWAKLASPYEGSFFGAAVTPQDSLLAFGMRGSVYRSTDQGASWSKVDVPTKLPFSGAVTLRDGRIVLTAGQGWLAISADDGQSFRLQRVGSGNLAGGFERGDGALVIYGEHGIQTVPSAALKNPGPAGLEK